MNKVIQPIHVYCLLFLSVSFLAHFVLIPTIFTVVEREAWISALASLIPILLLALLIFRITNKLNNASFFERQSLQDNKPLYLFIVTSYSIYLISSTFVSLKLTIIWADENFNSDYPYFITVLLFILLCFYGSLKGIKTIAIQSLIICSLYIFLYVVLNLGNSMSNEYELILPINTKNTSSILWGILYICIGILEMGFILIVLNGYVKERIKRKGILIFAILFVLLVFISIVTAISEFGIFLTTKMLFPINEQWRVLSFGKYFTRMDSFSVLQILSMAFIRICLFMYIISSFFKNRTFILFICYLSLTIGLLIPWSVSDFLSFIKNGYLPISFLFLICFFTFLYVLNLKVKGGKKIVRNE
ncbi:GerAB/ArcD/ProY family transporter [Lysinibacillus fusiformis]|uniref:GerAB/ArcD/ProY family transporter n=1 Tax=Lysinibacillus fusiformis TaxID=28031 RepID=UPI003CFC90D8